MTPTTDHRAPATPFAIAAPIVPMTRPLARPAVVRRLPAILLAASLTFLGGADRLGRSADASEAPASAPAGLDAPADHASPTSPTSPAAPARPAPPAAGSPFASPLSARPAPVLSPLPDDPEAAAAILRARHAGEVLARVLIEDVADLDRLLDVGADQWTHGHGPGWHDFRLTAGQLEFVRTRGLEHEVVREDLAELIAAEAARIVAADPGNAGGDAGDVQAALALAGVDFFADYRSIETIDAFVAGLVADHPGLATTSVIGQSLEGRPITVISITGAGDPADKPAVVINAMQHAREWITVPTVLWFADTMLDGYGVDPEITAILDAIELQIVPIVNPDGYVWTRDVQRLWRKNRRPNADGTFGVDLNRNWGFQWGGEGSSGDPDSQIYRGTAPFSEPETTVLAEYIIDRGDVAAHLDVHSFGQLILSPFGYDFTSPAGVDGLTHETLGRTFAEFIADVSGSIYFPGPAWTLYLASGTCSDWAHGAADAISFTFELRPASASGGGFILPPEQIVPTAEENRVAFLDLCRAVAEGVRFDFPGGRPEVVEASSPVPIEIAALPIASADLDPATARGLVRIDGGPVQVVALEPGTDEGRFSLALAPLACGTAIAFALEIESVDGVTYRAPAAEEAFFDATALDRTVAFADDAETDPGWTVLNVAVTGGAWERGVPAGDGDRGDPLVDADGSGAAWLTENGPGNTDLDGGPTRLVSPVIDLSGHDDPFMTVSRWMTNDDEDQDRLETFLSDDDGGSWVLVDSVNNLPGWTELTVRVADHVDPTATVRVRFDVTDNPNDSVTEAGIDAVSFFSVGCASPAPDPDLDGDGVVGFGDLVLVLGAWGPCDDCPEDLDGSGTVDLADLLEVLAAFE